MVIETERDAGAEHSLCYEKIWATPDDAESRSLVLPTVKMLNGRNCGASDSGPEQRVI
ncbi:hypothetical protein DFQ27_004240 [Actinomortierella ambigua]|uniref:Uncharacterized protein n=1 Tax=Actinomortierella ambigua TaxID=1343610 RepID=A0A9P6Q6I9_9FUNG|nr:hypothetical protein DFQ27_004240 [Actinomortierella ambigua]